MTAIDLDDAVHGLRGELLMEVFHDKNPAYVDQTITVAVTLDSLVKAGMGHVSFFTFRYLGKGRWQYIEEGANGRKDVEGEVFDDGVLCALAVRDMARAQQAAERLGAPRAK